MIVSKVLWASDWIINCSWFINSTIFSKTPKLQNDCDIDLLLAYNRISYPIITARNSSLLLLCLSYSSCSYNYFAEPPLFLLFSCKALLEYRWHCLSYFLIKTARMSLPCWWSNLFIVVQWLKSSLIILSTLFRSSKWAVNKLMLRIMSTSGIPVLALLSGKSLPKSSYISLAS